MYESVTDSHTDVVLLVVRLHHLKTSEHLPAVDLHNTNKLVNGVQKIIHTRCTYRTRVAIHLNSHVEVV